MQTTGSSWESCRYSAMSLTVHISHRQWLDERLNVTLKSVVCKLRWRVSYQQITFGFILARRLTTTVY